MITNYFKFHPVGQGGFYSGHLNHPIYPREDNSFDFVYDCGSLSSGNRLKELVNGVKTNLISKNKLDILFISHLDDDHVNGIKYLISNIRCEYIYLPYLTPFERLCVLIRHNKSDTAEYNDFIEFIVDPIDYLNSIEGANIGKITYLTGNSEGFPEDSNPEPPNEPGNFKNQISDYLEDDNSNSNKEMEALRANPQQKVVFKKANRKLFSSDIWEFFLYHIRGELKNIEAFIKKLNDLYKIKVDKYLNLDDLKEIVSDEAKLQLLRIKFKKHFKSLNKTGLVVQHKPINFKSLSVDKSIITNYPNYYLRNSYTIERYPYNGTGCTLLTGDIDFEDLGKIDYIMNNQRQINVFQVSHHGSANGWSLSVLRYIRPVMTTAVINFGFGNTYGHPRPEVLSDLGFFGIPIKFCNQFDDFDYLVNLYLQSD